MYIFIKKTIHIFTIGLLILNLTSPLSVNATTSSTSDTNTSPHMKIETYVINDTSNARVAGKSVAFSYTVSFDDVKCCTVRHDVSFTYGISTTSGHIAQITSGKAKVTYTNSNSAYYPNSDSISSTKTNGDPAKFISVTKIYKKSNDNLHAIFTNTTNCYASGEAS